MDLCQRCPKRPEAKFVQAVLVSLAARCPIFHATNHERIFYEGVRSEVQVRRRGGRVMSTAAGLEGAWSTRLEREAREDGRRRRGERLSAESAVRVFPGRAARLALDLAARERVAAVVRAHALVLAAVPVVMVVLADVLVVVALLLLGHIRVLRGRYTDAASRRDVGLIHSGHPWFCLRGVGASAFSLLGVRGTTMFGFVVQLGVCSLLGETLRRGIAASAQTKSYVLI